MYGVWFLEQVFGTPTGEDSRTDDSSKISQKHLEQVHDMVADAMLDLPPVPNVKGLFGVCVSLQITARRLLYCSLKPFVVTVTTIHRHFLREPGLTSFLSFLPSLVPEENLLG